MAQALGWGSGIPEVELTLAPVGGTGGEVRATTDEAGKARIDGLSQGSYLVTARRLLSDAERAGLGTASDAMAFVGANTLEVASGTGTGTMRIPASYRGSLLISEQWEGSRLVVGLGTYLFGGYVELYNNTDTTLYLDGMLIADALNLASESPTSVRPCALIAPFRDDSEGVWAQWIAAFPGSGREHPLHPGELVVVATDAVDHSVLYPGMLDLRGADFEFPGSADADNPAVSNMMDHSIREPFFNHGQYFGTVLSAVSVVSRAADPGTFTRGQLPPTATEHMRVPRADIIDVFTTVSVWYRTQPDVRMCPQLVNAGIDRKYGWLLGDESEWDVSASRRVLMTLPGDRVVLQNTRSTAADFENSQRTPGTVR
ncbi:MAG: DUF4876 domain-containing protein [Gemmatimonadaceae bacterium]